MTDQKEPKPGEIWVSEQNGVLLKILRVNPASVEYYYGITKAVTEDTPVPLPADAWHERLACKMALFLESYRRHYTLRPDSGPGKFEGELVITRYAWDISLDGGPDEEAALPDGQGWAGLMRGNIFRDDPTDQELSASEIAYLRDAAGVILRTDSNGFVYGEWFEDEDKLNERWAEVEKEYEWEDDERDE